VRHWLLLTAQAKNSVLNRIKRTDTDLTVLRRSPEFSVPRERPYFVTDTLKETPEVPRAVD
jgi:hypothetical protein